MSETEQTTALEPEGATAAPEAPETPAAEQQPEPSEHETRLSKRIGFLTSRAAQAERARDEMAARLNMLEQHVRSGGQPPPQVDPQFQQIVEQRAGQLSEAQRMQDKINAFHAAGREAYPDWRQQCDDLQAMGADPQIAQLLVEMPNGPQVVAALHNDAEALEQIAAARGVTARALALGQYAATIKGNARSAPRVPAPPPPVHGRVAPRFVEQQATTQQLVEHYSRQAMENRKPR
jgi:hypothetical protein